jgi:hypothetical protein
MESRCKFYRISQWEKYKIIDALILNLNFIKDDIYLTFKPDLLVLNLDESLPDHDVVKL